VYLASDAGAFTSGEVGGDFFTFCWEVGSIQKTEIRRNFGITK